MKALGAGGTPDDRKIIPWRCGDNQTEPASHGCIRMPYWKARQFYKVVHIGTPVVVKP